MMEKMEVTRLDVQLADITDDQLRKMLSTCEGVVLKTFIKDLLKHRSQVKSN